MKQTRGQTRFDNLEVAADWHELMIPQCTIRPSIVRVNEQLDPRFAASRHILSHSIWTMKTVRRNDSSCCHSRGSLRCAA